LLSLNSLKWVNSEGSIVSSDEDVRAEIHFAQLIFRDNIHICIIFNK
jgi:hypothetical protein